MELFAASLILMNTADMLEDLGQSFWHRQGASPRGITTVEIRSAMTDHAMHLMTGVQLLRCAQEQYPGMALILATGYAELPAGEKADVVRLPKPYSQSELTEALAKATQAVR